MDRWARSVRTIAGVSALAIASTALAGQAKSSFMIQLELVPAKSTAACDKTVSGSTVNVTCTPTGHPAPTGQPQQLFVFRQNNEWLGTIDAMMSTGTITSWRVVRGARWDYIELVVGW